MSEFNLSKSHWYNKTGIERASRYARDDAANIAAYAKNLLEFEFEQETADLIAKSETALSEALLAVKLARKAYEKKRPQLQAAE